MLLKQLEGNSQFSTFKRMPLPDGTEVLLYKRSLAQR